LACNVIRLDLEFLWQCGGWHWLTFHVDSVAHQTTLTADQLDLINRLQPFNDTFSVVEDENEDEFDG